MTLRQLCSAGLLGFFALLIACSDLPNQPSEAQEATNREHADDFDIFQAAWFHDPDLTPTWQTLIIHDEGRTGDNATVTLHESSGGIWRYFMERTDGAWSVQEALRLNNDSGIQFSVSSTDPVDVASVWGQDIEDIYFVPLEGTVISFIEFPTNEITSLHWQRSAIFWDDIEYGGGSWRVRFDRWFVCYDRAEAGHGSGYQCQFDERPLVFIDHFGEDENGDLILAKQVYLHYETEKSADPPDTNVASVEISPGPVSVGILDTVAVSAIARNASNQVLTGKSAVWTLENRDGEIATVEATGDMTARIIGSQLGTTTLIATVEGVDAAVTVHVEPTVTVAGPNRAVNESVTVTAAANPAESYYYVWRIDACEQRAGWPKGSCTTGTVSSDSGQDVTSQSWYIPQRYTYATFYVNIREHAGGPVLASGSWTVTGASELDCHLGICPEATPEPAH